MRRFLSFVVEEALAGREDRLKEYTIGVEVFDRTQDFDPRKVWVETFDGTLMGHEAQLSDLATRIADTITAEHATNHAIRRTR